jgi:hypothetical protein
MRDKMYFKYLVLIALGFMVGTKISIGAENTSPAPQVHFRQTQIKLSETGVEELDTKKKSETNPVFDRLNAMVPKFKNCKIVKSEDGKCFEVSVDKYTMSICPPEDVSSVIDEQTKDRTSYSWTTDYGRRWKGVSFDSKGSAKFEIGRVVEGMGPFASFVPDSSIDCK